jgi:hypothetical protein
MPAPPAPGGVLVLAIDPSLVWERDDAIIVGRSIPGTSDRPTFYAEAHVLADRRVEQSHLERIRELADRIDAQLPIEGLARASRLLADGITEIHADDGAAAWVAGALLADYACLVHIGKIERA